MFRGSSCAVLCAAFAIALGCGPDKNKRTTDPSAKKTKRRLVVLIVVDQLPSWSFGPQQTYLTGGIRRLLDNGTYYPKAEYPYAITYTAPGHAALATGAPPSITGVLANGWYNRTAGKSISATGDPKHPILQVNPGPGGSKEAAKRASGASPSKLRVTGVGDWLRSQTQNKGKAIAISIKSRAANFVLGQRPNLAVWYDAGQAAMTTSSWYSQKPPWWLVDLAKNKPVSKHFNYVWQPGSEALIKRATNNVDDAAGEGGIYGLDNKFPHELGRAVSAKALRATPIGPRITTKAALAALHSEKLGKDDAIDLLAVSYSSHDYAGHTWGQESWERFDLLLHIDRWIGRLLAELDRVVGKENYAVVLTSDHGVTKVVEQSRQKGLDAHRLSTTALMTPLQQAANKALGPGKWIAAGSASTIYMTKAFHALDETRKDAALDAMTKSLSTVKGIARAVRTRNLHGNCDRRKGLEALICRSIEPTLSGEIFVAVAPNSIFSGHYKSGTTHGSPNPDDRFVPLIVHVPGQKPSVVNKPVSTLSVAPTLARLLGIKAAAHAKAPALVD